LDCTLDKMERTGTVAIVFYTVINGDIHVLLGQETQFLSDLQNDLYISSTNLNEIFKDLGIESLAQLETTCNDEPYDVFRKHAEYLTQNLRLQDDNSALILFEPIRTIHNNDGSIEYTTRFRLVKQESVTKFGIVKGGMENDETERACIVREVYEEINFKLDESKLDYINTFILSRFQYDPLYIFSYFVPYLDIENFLCNINQLKLLSRGEMCHFKFVSYKSGLNKKLNQKSLFCLQQFYKIASRSRETYGFPYDPIPHL